MLKSIAVLIACSVGCLVLAHEHCHYDEREVDPDGVLTYCSMDYVTSGTCCTAEEEAALEATFNAAGSLTAECADYYQQTLCGVCGSFSGHLYERFAAELGTENGLTMKAEFCAAYTTACAGQIDFPDFGGIDYCTVVTGGGDEDLLWSYPYEERAFFDGDFTELFPDLPELPDTTIAMHQSPDDSMYWIAGKDGMLVRVDADSPSTSSTVMDLSGGIFLSTPEEGLLDFAFSPMFESNGYFYVSWTVREDGIDKNRLSKFEYFEGDPDATRNSEEMFLESSERPNFFHNGGWVGFKPSDYGTPADYHDLYWALGDAGRQQDPFDHGQRTDVLFGSVVRISVPSDGTGYEIPDGNYPDAVLPEICAIGFRNIWRCSFDRLTDDLYCGDVGHNEIESIDIVECGNNYGWVRFEGSRCTPYSENTYGSCVDTDRSDFTFPIFEYCHVDYDSTLSTEVDYTNGIDICGDRSVIGNAVIGGYVYRGQAYADLIYGAYVFGDHELGNIYYIMQEEDGTWTSGTIIDENLPILSFAEDNNGELFIIDERNTIIYLPCGNLCPTPDDNDDTTTPVDDTTDDPTGDDTTTPAEDDDDRTTTYEFIGCYGDQSDRVLSGLSLPGYSGLTTEFCAGFCTGSAYFGTQYGVQCFCGEATDDPTILGPADCGSPCAGDSTDTCGGRWALSVYQYWI